MRWRRRRFKRMRKRARELRALSPSERLRRIVSNAPRGGEVFIWDSISKCDALESGAFV